MHSEVIIMNEITYLIPKAAKEILEEIRAQQEYDVWLYELINIHKSLATAKEYGLKLIPYESKPTKLSSLLGDE